MSIGNRLFNLARAELNSLLDRLSEAEREYAQHRDPDEDLYRRFSLDELTDEELEAEIERRHRARQQSTKAAPGGRQRPKAASQPGGPAGGSTSSSRTAQPPRRPSPDDELRLAYAALEVPYGADFAIVRKSYRELMRKYHPDRQPGSPEKQRAATELAQKLTLAYKLIERRARR